VTELAWFMAGGVVGYAIAVYRAVKLP